MKKLFQYYVLCPYTTLSLAIDRYGRERKSDEALKPQKQTNHRSKENLVLLYARGRGSMRI